MIQRLAQSIDRERFELLVCCLKVRGPIGDELASSGVEVVVLRDAARQGPDYFTFLKLLRLIRRRRIEVVHTHTTDAFLEAASCKLLFPRFRLVHTFHFGNYPHVPRRQWWFERFGCLMADRLLAVGDAQRRQINAAFGLREGLVGRVWNGVAFNPRSSGAEFRRRIDAGDRPVIGTIATLIEQKGLFDFMAVARRCLDRGLDARFVIVGDGRLRADLEAERHRLGLGQTVILTGWLPDAAAVALPGFDVFFQPSRWEAMSIALLEAMTAALPVVTTRVGETPFIVDDGVDGLLVEPGDLEGMTGALVRLAGDRALRSALGAAAAGKVADRFTVDRMTRAYERIYASPKPALDEA